MSDINSSPALKRSFGMREAVTITAGSVIGVGLFTVGSNIVGLMGPSVIFATIVALLISVYPALLYAEMGAALPYAGGTYQFASVGIGRAAGVLPAGTSSSLWLRSPAARHWLSAITSRRSFPLSA